GEDGDDVTALGVALMLHIGHRGAGLLGGESAPSRLQCQRRSLPGDAHLGRESGDDRPLGAVGEVAGHPAYRCHTRLPASPTPLARRKLHGSVTIHAVMILETSRHLTLLVP